MAIDTRLLCVVDGGRIEEAVRGDKLIRTCMRCGIEERLDYVDEDALVLKRMDELERSMTDDGDDGNDRDDREEAPTILDGTGQPVNLESHAMRTPDRRVDELQSRRPRAAPSDWREVAKERLALLINQLLSAEEAAEEALQIHTALTSCGIDLQPLPGCVYGLIAETKEDDATVPLADG